MVYINEYLAGTLIILTATLIFFLFVWWKLWRRFLCPENTICDRDRLKRVNFFWMLVCCTQLFFLCRLLTLCYTNEWEALKEVLEIDRVWGELSELWG